MSTPVDHLPAVPAGTAITINPDVTPAQMLAIAVQQGAGLETVEKLMDLQDRWEQRQARRAFDAAIAGAKGEIQPVTKNKTVDFTSQKGRTYYQYEDLAQIAAHVDPILSRHGLSYRYRSQQDGQRMTMTCVLSHAQGHYEETVLSADNDESGNKNGIQAVGSVATYLQRYTLKLALGLAAAADDDGRANSGHNAPRGRPTTETPQPRSTSSAGNGGQGLCSDKQAAMLRKRLDASGIPENEFFEKFNVNAIEELPWKSVDSALQWIANAG